jgi:anti-sigma B factor antagonist
MLLPESEAVPHIPEAYEPGDADDVALFGRPFTVTVDPATDGVVVAHLAGDIDFTVAPPLRRSVLEHVDERVVLLVADLLEVSLLSAAGIDALLDLHEISAAHEVAMRVVARTRAVLRPLHLTGAHRRLSLYASVDDALQRRA